MRRRGATGSPAPPPLAATRICRQAAATGTSPQAAATGTCRRRTDYHAPGGGYREPPPAATAHAEAVQFAGRQQDPYPPTGPLPVGRWRTGEPSGEFPQAPAPEDGFAPDRLGDGGFAPDRLASGEFAYDRFAPDGFAEEGFAQDGFAQDGFTRDGFTRDGFAENEGFADEGFADGGFPDDPLAGGYQGEAEQGYLPSPPTDMFPAASLSGGYHGQGSHRAGYEPDPDDPDRASRYPAGHADRGGPPRDSAAHRQGRAGPGNGNTATPAAVPD